MQSGNAKLIKKSSRKKRPYQDLNLGYVGILDITIISKPHVLTARL
jgi:hypothetical protein